MYCFIIEFIDSAMYRILEPNALRPSVETVDLIYSQVLSSRSARQLRMSLLLPSSPELKPAVVYFPGGGFLKSPHSRYIQMRLSLAEAGFAVASVEYRVIPDRYPSMVVDGKSAVRFLRAHAEEFGIDPSRIAAVGNSAGGYLAQMVGVTAGEESLDRGEWLEESSEVQAVVSLYGISDLASIGEGFPEEVQELHRSPAAAEAIMLNGVAYKDSKGNSVLEDPAKALAASPMGHIRRGLPPFLVMHGDADTLVSPVQSNRLYEALCSCGNEADLVILKGAGHGDLPWYQQEVADTVVSWLSARFLR